MLHCMIPFPSCLFELSVCGNWERVPLAKPLQIDHGNVESWLLLSCLWTFLWKVMSFPIFIMLNGVEAAGICNFMKTRTEFFSNLLAALTKWEIEEKECIGLVFCETANHESENFISFLPEMSQMQQYGIWSIASGSSKMRIAQFTIYYSLSMPDRFVFSSDSLDHGGDHAICFWFSKP